MKISKTLYLIGGILIILSWTYLIYYCLSLLIAFLWNSILVKQGLRPITTLEAFGMLILAHILFNQNPKDGGLTKGILTLLRDKQK